MDCAVKNEKEKKKSDCQIRKYSILSKGNLGDSFPLSLLYEDDMCQEGDLKENPKREREKLQKGVLRQENGELLFTTITTRAREMRVLRPFLSLSL